MTGNDFKRRNGVSLSFPRIPLKIRITAVSSRHNFFNTLDRTQKQSGLREINTFRPTWNSRHLADDIMKRVFLNGNVWISIRISLKFLPKGPINNITALVQIMAWRPPGDKPLSEPVTCEFPAQRQVTRSYGVFFDLCLNKRLSKQSWG